MLLTCLCRSGTAVSASAFCIITPIMACDLPAHAEIMPPISEVDHHAQLLHQILILLRAVARIGRAVLGFFGEFGSLRRLTGAASRLE